MSEVLDAPTDIAVIEPGKAIALLSKPLVPEIVFKPGGSADILAQIRAEVRSKKMDISTEKGRKEIRALNRKIASSKTGIDDLGKEYVANAKKLIKGIDTERSFIWDEMEKLQDEVMADLLAWEAKQKAKVDAHEAALKAMADLTRFDYAEPAIDDIRSRLEALQAHADREWDEFSQRASDLHAETLDSLNNLMVVRITQEADRAEAARIAAEDRQRKREEAIRAQAEREKRIAVEAAEAARLAAEQESHRLLAEQQAKAAEEREAAERRATAEREAAEQRAEALKQDAERREQEAAEKARQAEADRIEAVRQAELDRIEAAKRHAREVQEAAERAERDRLAAEARHKAETEAAVRKAEAAHAAALREEAEAKAAADRVAAKRAADKAHRGKINRAALDVLMRLGLTEEVGMVVISAIARGDVPHVRVDY